METHERVYDVCQHYVRDHASYVSPELVQPVSGWLRSRSLSKLASAPSLLGSACTGAEDMRFLMQVAAFFKKNAVFVDEERCLATAREAFLEAELKCKETNERLDNHYDESFSEFHLLIVRAQYYIESTLGPISDFIEALPDLVGVSSGATARRPRSKSTPIERFNLKMDCTPTADKWLRPLATFFGYRQFKPSWIHHNRVAFVPKNWKTHRTIACEPEGNVCLQLAFDKYAKRKLRRRGIDLSDQIRNSELAREGSIRGNYATIDLSSASDTLSTNAVLLLLPKDWFRFLADVRCRFYKLPGDDTLYRYHKFSSMGNGATFSLETLCFAAACYAVGCPEFSVYGDDIIVPTQYYGAVTGLLAYLGFSVNAEKSFYEGPFRESCGGNFYSGIDITPFYLRSWDKRKSFISHNVNGLVSISVPGGELEGYAADLVSEHKLPLIPFGLDTTRGVFIDTPSCYSKGLLKRREYGSLHYKGFVSKSRTGVCYDSRALFIWFMRKRDSADSCVESSRYPILSHKYVKAWVNWLPAPAPLYLYSWSERLAAG